MASRQNERPVFGSKCFISNRSNSFFKFYLLFVLNALPVKMKPFLAAERQRKSILRVQKVENVENDVVNE